MKAVRPPGQGAEVNVGGVGQAVDQGVDDERLVVLDGLGQLDEGVEPGSLRPRYPAAEQRPAVAPARRRSATRPRRTSSRALVAAHPTT